MYVLQWRELMKQITVRVVGWVVVTVKDDFKDDGNQVYDIPMKLDTFNQDEDSDSPVVEVIETDITTKEIVTEVPE